MCYAYKEAQLQKKGIKPFEVNTLLVGLVVTQARESYKEFYFLYEKPWFISWKR